VLDTIRGKLLYESGIPPRLYAPLEDFDHDVLARTDHSTHCPFKGDASYWSVSVNGTVRENAVWAYESPTGAGAWLEGYASLYDEQADEWWVEDELVRGRLRDPFHRVDVLPSSRRVRITAGEELIADTDRAVLLFETGLPARVCPESGRAGKGRARREAHDLPLQGRGALLERRRRRRGRLVLRAASPGGHRRRGPSRLRPGARGRADRLTLGHAIGGLGWTADAP
jgi:uncharacterized protein (DUF427 family)